MADLQNLLLQRSQDRSAPHIDRDIASHILSPVSIAEGHSHWNCTRGVQFSQTMISFITWAQLAVCEKQVCGGVILDESRSLTGRNHPEVLKYER